MIDSWERLALKYLKHYIIIKYTIFVRHESGADIGILNNEAFIFELRNEYEKCLHILKLMYFINLLSIILLNSIYDNVILFLIIYGFRFYCALCCVFLDYYFPRV